MQICDSKKCVGCNACVLKCPTKAIKIISSSQELIPIVDEKKCLHCDLCRLTC